jgi:hypothetical protein
MPRPRVLGYFTIPTVVIGKTVDNLVGGVDPVSAPAGADVCCKPCTPTNPKRRHRSDYPAAPLAVPNGAIAARQ